MKINRRMIMYIFYALFGVALVVMGCVEMVDEFWSGIGGGLAGVGVVRLIWTYRYNNNENYREKVDVATTDERNRFIRNKAWAWAGYLFILLVGSSVIVLKLMGQDLLSLAASYAVCLMLVLYWGSYMILRRKY